MDISTYDSYSFHHEECTFLAAFTGAGANPPVKSASSVARLNDNFASSATRSGVGAYVLTLRQKVPEILAIVPTVVSSDGALRICVVKSWDLVAGTVTVQVMDAAVPAADDLEATDVLRLVVFARLSTA